jgi:hypothetical protein
MQKTIFLLLAGLTVALADGYESDFQLEESFSPRDGVIVYEKVHIRKCPSTECEIVAIGKEGDTHSITGKTVDGKWYQIDGVNYIREYLVRNSSDVVPFKKDALKEIVATKLSNELLGANTNEKSSSVPISNIQTTEPNESDSIYIQSPELAEKYRNDALIANLTQASSPKPVMKSPRYARVLIFPILNEKGDVYYDYNYAWVKIKDESFVLGQREGKETSNGFFSIHKKVE